MLVMALSSALEPLSHLRESGGGVVRGLAAKADALRAAPHPALRAAFSRELEKRYREGAPALQHAALDLVALDGLEQGLEVAFAEAFVALALDDLEEDRAERVRGEDLQQLALVGFRVGVDQDLVLRQPGHVLARSEEHTSELQSLMRNSYAVF